MTDPVTIAAAAYLLLNGQVAEPTPRPVAVAIDCQDTMNMSPHPAEHARPPGRGSHNHLTVRWRPHPAPVHHHRHHRG
jgi:hypothetical protein